MSAIVTTYVGYEGSKKSADATKEGAKLAAGATLTASRENIDFQKWLWGEQKDLLQPFADMGTDSISQYQSGINKPIDIKEDPSYQFRLDEGAKTYENSASAKGMSLSGSQAKAMTRYGQDYASTEYTNAFNRRQVNLDNLYRMINSGQAASAGQAAAGGTMGSQVSNSINNTGRANAQMYTDVASANAAQAQAPYNMLMDWGNLGANLYGGGK